MNFSEILSNEIPLSSSLRVHLNQAKTLKELQKLILDISDKQKVIVRLYNQCKQLKTSFPYSETQIEIHLINHDEIHQHINKNLLEFKKVNPLKKKIKQKKRKPFTQIEKESKISSKLKSKKKFKNPYARLVSTPMYS